MLLCAGSEQLGPDQDGCHLELLPGTQLKRHKLHTPKSLEKGTSAPPHSSAKRSPLGRPHARACGPGERLPGPRLGARCGGVTGRGGGEEEVAARSQSKARAPAPADPSGGSLSIRAARRPGAPALRRPPRSPARPQEPRSARRGGRAGRPAGGRAAAPRAAHVPRSEVGPG